MILSIEGYSIAGGRDARLVRNNEPANLDVVILGELRVLVRTWPPNQWLGTKRYTVSREESTRLSEPAPFITTEELGRFAGEYRKLVAGADAVVLSGGLASGLPLDIYASLASYAAEASVPAIVHAGGTGPVAQPGPASRAGADRVDGRGGRGRGIHRPGRPAGPGREGGGHAVRRGPARRGVLRPGGPWRAALEGYPACRCPRRPWWPGCCPPSSRAGHGRMRCGTRWPSARRPTQLGEVDLDAYDMLSSEVVVARRTARPPADGSARPVRPPALSPEAAGPARQPPPPRRPPTAPR